MRTPDPYQVEMSPSQIQLSAPFPGALSTSPRLPFQSMLRTLLADAGWAATPSVAVATATPAIASWSRTISWQGDSAQVDNAPGNGGASWLWVADASSDGKPAYVEFQYYNDQHYYSHGVLNGSATKGGSADVWRFQLCKDIDYRNCGGWAYMS